MSAYQKSAPDAERAKPRLELDVQRPLVEIRTGALKLQDWAWMDRTMTDQ